MPSDVNGIAVIHTHQFTQKCVSGMEAGRQRCEMGVNVQKNPLKKTQENPINPLRIKSLVPPKKQKIMRNIPHGVCLGYAHYVSEASERI